MSTTHWLLFSSSRSSSPDMTTRDMGSELMMKRNCVCIFAVAAACVLLANTCDAQKIYEQGRLVSSKSTETITRMKEVFPPALDGKSPYSDTLSITQQCQRDLLATLTAQAQFKSWAWLAIDSGGQVGPGVYQGNLNYLGNFDQCQKVKASGETYTINVGGQDVAHKHTSDGKYCRVYWLLEENKYDQLVSKGDCVPESCTEEDMGNIYSHGNENVSVIYVYCDKGKNFFSDPVAIAGLVITVFLVGLVLVASLVHACRRCKSNCKSSTSQLPTTQAGSETTQVPLQSVADGANNRAGNDESPETAPDPKTGASPQHEGNSALNSGEVTVETPPDKKPDKPNKCVDVLLSFSLLRNVPPLLATESRAYSCMNGIRVLAMLWVLYGHSYQLGRYIISDARLANLANSDDVFGEMLPKFPYSAFVENNALPVDIFFVLSASLVTISFMKALERNNGRQSCKQMTMYYVHRYIRLTPVYMFVAMLFACFFLYLDNGPTPPELMEYNYCQQKWWINLFYLQNVLFKQQSCMGWTWYVANDWAFYCVAPLFIYFLYRWPKFGRVFIVIVYILYLCLRTFLFVFSADYFHDVYIPPWSRIGPYLMGIGLGNAMFATKCKVAKMNKHLLRFLWIVVVVLSAAVLYNYTYFTIIKGDLMAVATCILVFLCCSGYGGFINAFLSWSFFVPLSRLTYAAYLVHPILIYYHTEFMKRPYYMEQCSMFFFYHGYLLATFIVAFFITLVFEIPFLELEKQILPKRR